MYDISYANELTWIHCNDMLMRKSQPYFFLLSWNFYGDSPYNSKNYKDTSMKIRSMFDKYTYDFIGYLTLRSQTGYFHH